MGLKIQKLVLFSLVLSSTLLIVTPSFASARGLVPCGGYLDDQGVQREKPCTFLDIFTLIARVTNWLIAMAGVYAVYKIIDGGFWLVASVGNEEAITQNKGKITNAVLGFILCLMAFMIVNTVVNFLLTRSLVTVDNPSCKLDLTNPKTYLTIQDTSKCSSVSDTILHQ